MSNFTPAQIKAIQGWTEQRDNLLREIGMYTTQRDDIRKSVAEEGLSLTDIQKNIAESRGRLAELDEAEERRRTSVSIDVAELEARKSRLEGECEAKQKELEGKIAQHAIFVAANDSLKADNEVMKDQAAIVTKVLGEIVETSKTHLSDTKNMMVEIKTISAEVIEKNNKNLEQTNIILGELPRFVFEMQKPIPIRRAYATPKGTIVRPKEEEIH